MADLPPFNQGLQGSGSNSSDGFSAIDPRRQADKLPANAIVAILGSAFRLFQIMSP